MYLIVERHPVKLCKAVSDLVDRNGERISMYLLPGYSSDLSPDELLTNDVKSNALGMQRPAYWEEIVEGVRAYFRSQKKAPEVVMR